MAFTANPFLGYPGIVWLTTYKTLNYYMDQLAIANTSGNVASVIDLSNTVMLTLLNAVDAIDAQAQAIAWQVETSNLDAIAIIPVAATITDATFFNNRLAAYSAAATALAAIVPQPPFAIPTLVLPTGTPAIGRVDLLEFYESFNYETQPVGLTNLNFAAQAQSVSDAFNNIATLLKIFQGLFPTGVVDTAQREADCAYLAAYLIASFSSGTVASNINVTNAWNQIVTLPAMTACSSTFTTAPFSTAAQQSAAIRNVLLTTAGQIALFLLTLNRPAAQQISLATLRINESLMDLANRTLGNFEQWTAIATLNGLVPPYVGAAASPGIAAWGDQLLIPTPGSSPSAGGRPPSYTEDSLGTDLYVGPINGTFPAWTGDFQTISGYNNLAWALGRRLQTTLGTMIYNSDYGSRIPPEIGMVQDSNTAAHIAAYGKSSLLADPRVQRVLSATASIQTFGTINFQGVVQPIGIGTRPIGLNQVITPLN